ncbi:Rieske 2Fe-2S domain-containing protein [Plastoroseomonas arctica]|uniref:Rieske 2Fe-2S domain-containing protein n=1 Tax=Plastoroseomonas arctica TaxID=1509237 RepID=A0AAF1KK10_9PROT|nr:Rieske 2Fe-2S domain-containing protein [Plastoroseomonas arctica]MBR0656160.1 Rieske 2Fe-2S domain-containing protein [Plastoroseomonas arctica]
MSVRYGVVGWTPAKRWYDAVLLGAIALYLVGYTELAPMLVPESRALDGQSLRIKAFGSAAFLLLTFALAIGPLARLDRRFLPLLYNRRHLGVMTFALALAHALEVLGWHFAFSPTPPLVAALSSEPGLGTWPGTPFVPFGILALLILFALAATSHDFWLNFLTPPVWKALHLGIYLAYAAAVAHQVFGYFLAAANPGFVGVTVASAGLLLGLHLAAGLRGRRAPILGAEWVRAAAAADIPEGGAVVVEVAAGEPVAIFRNEGQLSAVSNLCAHQNGPLGEGRVVDGCITCPWHGFQYRLADGCAPAPYTEKLATYRLRVEGGEVFLDVRACPPGTYQQPVPA